MVENILCTNRLMMLAAVRRKRNEKKKHNRDESTRGDEPRFACAYVTDDKDFVEILLHFVFTVGLFAKKKKTTFCFFVLFVVIA